MRVAHSGDFHLTEGPRFHDTLQALQYVVDDGIAQGVELWAGLSDLSGTTVPHRATLLEHNALEQLVQRMADHAPVVILGGNHDKDGDLDDYARLHAAHPIYVVTEPAVLDICDWQSPTGVRVFVFPYPWKRDWCARHADEPPEAQDAAIERDLAALLAGWKPQVDEARAAGTPTLLVGHALLAGAAVAGGEEIPAGQELTLSIGDVQALGVDYAAFTHIHLCQEMGDGIWYAGSPSRSNFGETDEKGYLVVDVTPGQLAQVHRRLTPVRRFITAEATWSLDTGDGTPGWVWDTPLPDDINAAEVRVKLRVPEEASATCPTAELEASLRGRGAVSVALPRQPIVKEAMRCPAIAEAERVEDQLGAYWDLLGEAGPDAEQRARCLTKYSTLRAEVAA